MDDNSWVVERNPQLDVISISDNEQYSVSSVSSEDENLSVLPTPSRSLLRSDRKNRVWSQRSPSPVVLSRHKHLTFVKRAVSAPCRVPLRSDFPPRKISLDVHGEDSESESSVPSPYSPGPNAYGAFPNPMDELEGSPLEQARHRALQARVENYREMKLNGIIVNYVERSSRRGKSIIEKLGKEPEVLKLYMKGYNGAPATVSPHSNKSVKHLKHRQSMMPAQKYGNVPSNLVSIIQRVTPGREIYPKLEDVVVKGFRLGGNDEEVESDLVPWSDTVGVIRVDCFYVTELAEENTPESASCCDEVSPKAKLTFTFPSNCGKEFSAFCRIWLHSLCHFHGIGGKSLKGKGGKGGKFVIKGKVGEVDDGRLTEEVNRRWEE